MTEHDDLIREARRKHATERMHYEPDALPPISPKFREGYIAALEARPSLVVRGEEELARDVGYPVTPDDVDEAQSDDYAEGYARGFNNAFENVIASGVVTVAPSLVAETRDAVREVVETYLLRMEKGSDHGADDITDALLAPGGPVRLADATPEPTDVLEWIRTHVAHFQTRDHVLTQAAERFGVEGNPYDGFTRREQNDGE